VIAFITFILLNYTRLGKSAYALGANVNAAEVAGINISRSIVLIYSYAGLLCGVPPSSSPAASAASIRAPP
jgi:inositol transport system permease protein